MSPGNPFILWSKGQR